MFRPNCSASGGRRHPLSGNHPRCGFNNSRNHNNDGTPFQRPPYHQHRWKAQFPSDFRDRPPSPPRNRPNFIVQLRSDAQRVVKCAETEALVQTLEFQPQKLNVVPSNYISASLFYEQWSEARETMVQLWQMKLNDKAHVYLPRVVSNVEVDSDRLELDDRLKVLFLEKLKGLREGDLVVPWQKKLGAVLNEIDKVMVLCTKPQKLGVVDELLRTRNCLEAERDLILNRMQEFKSGIKCIEDYLENRENNEGDTPVFQFSSGKIVWERIYWLMMRECRRLDDGLPIYAHRRDIMQRMKSQQVTVLIGETGSGKSTQLVQFLADSGVSGQESIVCTQPRKLAALSLTERVKEEGCGCYNEPSAICYPSYSSLQKFESKVIFMTDNCLLQHYMRDKQLSRISCIIVDEAHERSLNTDLLLALIKSLLCQRPNLRLIIMSATVDANQFSDYFFGCRTLHVSGRNFPVDIKYVPSESSGFSASKLVPSYVDDVSRMVSEIIKTEKEGTILAFLTSQMEVEWACEKLQGSSAAVVLPLHGKLSYEDQRRVFLAYPGKRKVIFATNVAETSLTIPGVKFVIDSGMVKESMFEPSTGMNVLKVCRISQSSANQRAGRAGRTEPGICYRLYTENDFECMLPHQEPEIRKVHLSIAVLKIIALGMKDVQEFEFVDAPSPGAIDTAVRNLIQIGAIAVKNDVYALTPEGRDIVKLGIEPRLGKIILQCFRQRLGKEGIVLSAVMLNSSSIFCRVGTEEDKLKSDRLKVQFCHPNGDIFTLLAVYKEWEAVPREKKNMWCWENSINAKSMRRCQDTVLELESCLKNELNIILPNYWYWNPVEITEHDKNLKRIILTSMSENVAMYSGYDHLGYEVALTRKHVQLHPSCSLYNFGERPAWVVFGEILSASNEYLVCVTACDFECFSTLSPHPVFDFLKMSSQQLQKRPLSGFGSVLLKRFCGKSNSNLRFLVSSVRESCGDERISVEVDVDQNLVLVHASSQDMERVVSFVVEGLECEKKLLQNECSEECLYTGGPTVLPSIVLFGAGAQIKHLELEKRYLSVDIFHSNIASLDEKKLLHFLEESAQDRICAISKFSGFGVDNEVDKWGRVTFSSPDAASKAVDLNQLEFSGGLLKIVPSRKLYGGDHKMMPFHSIKSKILWPRRCSKGVAILKCDPKDVALVVEDLSNMVIAGRFVWCEAGMKSTDSVVLTGLDRELSEADIYEVLSASTNRQITDFFLVRGNAVDCPSSAACEEAIMKLIYPFMPRKNQGNCVHVQVFPPEPKVSFMKAAITFDGNLHLEAARALEQIDGKVLPGCQSWQKLQCQHLFHTHVSCSAFVYPVISSQLHSLLSRLRRHKGVECNLETMYNGMGKISSYRVKISASATKVVADLRRPLKQLMEGTIIQHPDMTPAVFQNLYSRDGIMLMKSIQRETGTHIIFERHRMIVRVFGSPDKIDAAQNSLVKALSALHDSKQLEIQLRDGVLPPDMMKRVVQHFGHDLNGLKQKLPEAEFSLNARRHSISIVGTKELKQKVEVIIHQLAQTSEVQSPEGDNDNSHSCPICLCEVEDSYFLEDCLHEFCRLCLVEQCESAMRNHDTFPLCCTKEGCGAPILLSDLRTLLSKEKLDELFRASLGSYVATSGGIYRFCPSPDCPSVYRVADRSSPSSVFSCGACFVETCTQCHLEYHPYLSCEKYQEFKDDPDSSLKEWCMGKDFVKACPCCGFTIEKVDGCNHIECRCGRHVCWTCLEMFENSSDCYAHLRSVHTELFDFVL